MFQLKNTCKGWGWYADCNQKEENCSPRKYFCYQKGNGQPANIAY